MYGAIERKGNWELGIASVNGRYYWIVTTLRGEKIEYFETVESAIAAFDAVCN